MRINKEFSTSFVPCSEPKLTNRIQPFDAEFFGESIGVIKNGRFISLFFSYGPDKFSKVTKCHLNL